MRNNGTTVVAGPFCAEARHVVRHVRSDFRSGDGRVTCIAGIMQDWRQSRRAVEMRIQADSTEEPNEQKTVEE